MTTRRTLLGAAAAAAAALQAGPAAAQQNRIPVGHLMDTSGPTSDFGVPYAQGIGDAFAWVNATRGGVAGRQLNVLGFDYGYQAPRAVAQYQAWISRDRIVAIQGWGTADTEALVRFAARDRTPYVSGSYSAALTDAAGRSGRQGVEAAPFNFFYGPSYSDALRAMLRWARQDRGQQGRPRYVHMGANHPYPNSPKEAGESLAREFGFEVLPAIQFPLAPGDYTAQCLTLRNQGANYADLGNTSGANVSLPRACHTAGVRVQFLSNVWGIDENAIKAAGAAADGVVFPVRTAVIWGQDAPGMETMRQVSRRSDPSGGVHRPTHYLTAVCSALLMVEAMAAAAANGDELTGARVRDGFYARRDWVPRGTEGVCVPVTYTPEDHRPTMRVALYRAVVGGDTSQGPVAELIRAGTMRIEPVTTIELERRGESLGW